MLLGGSLVHDCYDCYAFPPAGGGEGGSGGYLGEEVSNLHGVY